MSKNKTSTGSAYFVTVNNNRVHITDLEGRSQWAVGSVTDVEIFVKSKMGEDDTLFKSSSLDFADEYADREFVINLAKQVNDAYFRS